jgi:hypothetical protein
VQRRTNLRLLLQLLIANKRLFRFTLRRVLFSKIQTMTPFSSHETDFTTFLSILDLFPRLSQNIQTHGVDMLNFVQGLPVL